MRDLALCRWQLQSQLAMPGSRPFSASDITLSLGPVPDRISDVVVETPFLQIGACRTFRLEVPAVARCLVRDACNVTIAAGPEAPPDAVRAFLFGPVLGLLAMQRGLIALRASAVRIGAHAVVLAGESRRGKSTLAAALALRGHHVLADDICVIETATAEARLRPLSGYVRLWRDTAEALGFPLGPPCRAGQQKYSFALPTTTAGAAPLPVAAIYIMRTAYGETVPGVSTLDGDAVPQLAAQVHGRAFAAALCDRDAPVSQIPPTVPVHRILQRFVFGDLNDIVGALEARHGP